MNYLFIAIISKLFLEFWDFLTHWSVISLQISIDDAEALIKRLEDFEKNLLGLEERLKALDEIANQLLSGGHPDSALWINFPFLLWSKIFILTLLA